MGLTEKLTEIKAETDALLDYANQTTGGNDVRLGEAVRTLADGFGQGGSDDTLDKLINREITEIMSSVTKIGNYAFYGCSDLTTADFPLATSIGSNAFTSCSSLTTADFPLATSISSNAFYRCGSLTTLILRNTTQVCMYSNTNAMNDPYNANLKIYVPRALLESYKIATNWSRLADKFVALEDYTVDGTTTGELDPTKTG